GLAGGGVDRRPHVHPSEVGKLGHPCPPLKPGHTESCSVTRLLEVEMAGDRTPPDSGANMPVVTADENHTAAERAAAGVPPRQPIEVVEIDMWEINQRAMERIVAEGGELPEGITPKMVADWRAEHGPGEISRTYVQGSPWGDDEADLAEALAGGL